MTRTISRLTDHPHSRKITFKSHAMTKRTTRMMLMIAAMPMDKLQEKAVYQIPTAITIPPNKGLLLTLQQ